MREKQNPPNITNSSWEKEYNKCKAILSEMEQLHSLGSQSAQHGLQYRLLSRQLEPLLIALSKHNVSKDASILTSELQSRLDTMELTRGQNSSKTQPSLLHSLTHVVDSIRDNAGKKVNYKQQIARQEQELEQVSKAVTAIKEMSCSIHKELTSQNAILDHMNEEIDMTKSSMTSVIRQAKSITKK